MKKKSAKLNFLFNAIYQIFLMIVPLITTPYVSRVLGVSGLGQYAFTNSIVSYFILIGSFGFAYYAQREIAKKQENKDEVTVTFWEIFIARFICIMAVLVIYLLCLLFGLFNEYQMLMSILLINIVAVCFDIVFLFQGMEEFGKIVLRNIVVKIIGITLIFVFVKGKDDVWIYVLCNSLVLIGSNLSLWFFLPKYLNKHLVRKINFKRHFIPSLRLFIPTIAVSIYTMLDKTLIGLLVDGFVDIGGETKNLADVENGYYEQSEKLVKLSLTIITALSTVMISRNSSEFAAGNHEKVKKNIYTASNFALCIGIPMIIGISLLSSMIVPWFFGPGYEKCIGLIMAFSPLILLISLNHVFGLQYLIPIGKERQYTIGVLCGAGTNLILNLILIPLFMSYGALIATVIAELLILIIFFIFLRKQFSVIKILKMSIKYIISGVLMGAILFLLKNYFTETIVNTFILLVIGVACYFSTLLLLRDAFLIDCISKILSKFIKRKNKEE